jgi:hypothetical protein
LKLIVIIRYLIFVVAALAILAGSITAILFSPQLADWRRAKAAEYLSDLLGQKVTVNADVGIDLGSQIIVDISDIIIDNPLQQSTEG